MLAGLLLVRIRESRVAHPLPVLVGFDPRGKADDPLAALGFEWRLYKAPGSLGWTSPEGGDEDYTVHRLGLDVLPVRMAQPLYGPWAAPAAR